VGLGGLWANTQGCPKVNTCTYTIGMNVCLRENGRGGGASMTVRLVLTSER
jgi:hypothetical protein